MALATQCPYCNTTFRVVHDQLKLRAGLVRCGSCKQIFNGIENLSRPEEPAKPVTAPLPPAEPAAIPPPATGVAATPEPATAPSLQAQVATFDFSIDDAPDAVPSALPPIPTAPTVTETEMAEAADTVDAEDAAGAEFAPVNAPEDDTEVDSATPVTVPMPAIPDTIPEDPLLRMTLIDFSDVDESVEAFVAGEEALASAAPATDDLDTAAAAATKASPAPASAAAEAPDEVEQAIDDLQRKPWRRSTADETDALDQLSSADAEEPGFVKRARRNQRIGRVVRIFVGFGSIILLLGALGQGTYIFRNQLAAWLPQTKPLLTEACTWIHCSVTLPSQLEDVTIESSELQTLAPKKEGFALTLLLRNYSATAQTWPHLELLLNDADEKAIARRIFTPQEYLPPKSDPAKGFSAHSEQPVKITFELLQLTAAGYRVYLFYP